MASSASREQCTFTGGSPAEEPRPLTGEELAQKAGVGRSAVIKMRKGQPVWRTTAGHVAAALGVTVDDLKEEV